MRKLNLREPLTKIQILKNVAYPSEAPKRNLKIYTQKLPLGFFSDNRNLENNREPSTARSKLKMYSRTQKLPELVTKEDRSPENCKTAASSRVLQTDDQLRDNDSQLIMGLINSARSIKRMIRKHSLQIRRNQNEKGEAIELPPLKFNKNKQHAVAF